MVLSILVGLLASAALFYWLVSAFIDTVVFFRRSRGDSTASAVPGVASITGIVLYICCRRYFQIIESPRWLAALLLPDVLCQAGELILWFRVRVLGWPARR